MLIPRPFCALLIGPLLTTAAQAALSPGTQLWNPQLSGQLAYFSADVPAWVLNPPATTLTSAISPPPMVTPFVGTVESAVYFRNGVDASDGLAFTYRFTLDSSYAGDTLKRALFFPDTWKSVEIDAMGADTSGTSTPHEPDSMPPGMTSWSDGSPYRLSIDTATESPEIRWTGGLGGTALGGGDLSALIWFETTGSTWTTGTVTLIDTVVGGAATILVPLPEPATALLMLAGAALLRRRKVLSAEA